MKRRRLETETEADSALSVQLSECVEEEDGWVELQLLSGKRHVTNETTGRKQSRAEVKSSRKHGWWSLQWGLLHSASSSSSLTLSASLSLSSSTLFVDFVAFVTVVF